MYISQITIENFRCFGEGESRFRMCLNRGLTALVGGNDAGKTAVIDALRYALGTTDLEWHRYEDSDFHGEEFSRQIRVTLEFEGLSLSEQGAFVEYLTYPTDGSGAPVTYLHWTVEDKGEDSRGRRLRLAERRCGRNGDGPRFEQEVLEKLRARYLRPLRDAETAMSAGRNSRISQILRRDDRVRKTSGPYDLDEPLALQKLSVAEIGRLADDLLREHEGVQDARKRIAERLGDLSLADDPPTTSIEVAGAGDADARLRSLLEKLDLVFGDSRKGRPGLGSSNLLFIACEQLLIGTQAGGSRLLLIEEPEAHLHPQRQLSVMEDLQKQADETGLQIIITTHSPNLASVIELDNMVMIQNGRAFPLGQGHTKLAPSDYRFLERFLDVTKANLFFARGVMIVEGDAENILLPTLAKLIDRDFTKYGVSIVNVGHTGLGRYARIFMRDEPDEDGYLDIPVACLADMDVMPDCAPEIIGRDADWRQQTGRRWKAKWDYDNDRLRERREAIRRKATDQMVQTFVSDEWTLEYDLALGRNTEDGEPAGDCAEMVYIAAHLARRDDDIFSGKTNVKDEAREAASAYATIVATAEEAEGCCKAEWVASTVYAQFAKEGASKAIAAQYLAERLNRTGRCGKLTPEEARARLPKYIVDAIDYVTGAEGKVNDE